MLMGVGGSRLYIGEERGSGADPYFSASSMGENVVEIGGTESLGALGIRWETLESGAVGEMMTETLKGVMRSQAMELVVGVIANDPGQLRLWEAARSPENFPFRLDFPTVDGTTEQRLWLGTITEFAEVFEGASSVMRYRAVIYLNSPVIRSTA